MDTVFLMKPGIPSLLYLVNLPSKLVRDTIFFWADYGIAADFGKNPGVAFLMWRGPTDRHATALSTTHGPYERWGSSIQVTSRLYNAVKRVQAGEGKAFNDATRREPQKQKIIAAARARAARQASGGQLGVVKKGRARGSKGGKGRKRK
ncbi:hypothetical protein BDV93DRAFT_514837 [Ceratobasidium sp. AG-I]|nr:hypothetical protein BDV93DRAFT_514837 [Ceratobasidium sp. AG-I]